MSSGTNIKHQQPRNLSDPNVIDGLRPNNGGAFRMKKDVAGENTSDVIKSTSPAGTGPKQTGL